MKPSARPRRRLRRSRRVAMIALLLGCAVSGDHPQVGASHWAVQDPPALPPDTVVATDASAGVASVLGHVSAGVGASGQAQVGIPLWVPPGRAGMQPNLGLAYNSQGGDGFLGEGWSLGGLSQISRCSKTQLEDGADRAIQYDGSDALCLDGQRLVQVASDPVAGTADYRTREDSFTRVVATAFTALGPNAFVVYSKSGLIRRYGTTAGSVLDGVRSIYTRASDGSLGTQEGQQSVRLRWGLSEVEDRFGNYLTVTYSLFSRSLTADIGGYEQLPTSIDYTFSRNSAAPSGRRIAFLYVPRPDPSFQSIQGLTLVRTTRLSEIDAYGPNPAAQGLLRKYLLGYVPQGQTNRTLLGSVTECDGAGVCAAPTSIAWNAPASRFTDVPTQVADQSYPTPDGNTQVEGEGLFDFMAGDINGDGCDDLIYQSWSNPDQQPIRVARLSACGGQIGLSQARLLMATGAPMDVDQDAQVDLVDPLVTRNGATFHVEVAMSAARTALTCAPLTLFAADVTMTTSLQASVIPNVALADLNDDHVPDLVLSLTGQDYIGPPLVGHLGPAPITHDGVSSNSWRVIVPITGHGVDANGCVTIDHALPAVWRPAPAGSPNLVESPDGNPAGALAPDPDSAFYLLHRFNADWTEQPGPETGLVAPDRWSPPRYVTYFADLNGDGHREQISIDNGAADLTQPDSNLADNHFFVAWNGGAGYRGPLSTSLPADGAFTYNQLPTTQQYFIFRTASVLGFDGSEDVLYEYPLGSRAANLWAMSLRTGVMTGAYLLDAGGSPLPSPSLGPNIPSEFGSYYESALDAAPPFTFADVNGDGRADIIESVQGRVHIFVQSPPPAVQSVTAPGALCATFTYKPLSDPSVYTRTLAPGGSPLHVMTSGMNVVSAFTSSDGTTANHYAYTYTNGVMDLAGGGWLGFESTVATHAENGSSEQTAYGRHLDREGSLSPYRALPTSVVRTVSPSSGITRRDTSTFTYSKTVTNGGATLFVWPQTVVAVGEEWAGAGPPVEIRRVTTTAAYDAHGSLTSLAETTGDGYASSTTITYNDDDPASWLFGLADSMTQTSTTPSGTPSQVTRHVHWTHWPQTDALHTTEVEPGGATDVHLVVTTTPDAFGRSAHVQSVDDLGHQRDVTVTYDTVDQVFPVQTSTLLDAQSGLRATSGTAYHPGLGVLGASRDANGATTTSKYDGFGRIKAVTRPELTVGAGGEDVPSTATTTYVYGPSLTVTRTAPTGSTEALTLDGLGRPLTAVRTAADGTHPSTRTTYTSFGEVASVQGPCLVLDASCPTTSFQYDGLGRLTQQTLPDGASSHHTYSGLSESIFDPDGRERRIAMDQMGRVVSSSVVDTSVSPARVVTSTLDYGPFGLLRQETDAQLNVTSMEYDVIGRRTRLVDPNLGTRTFAYTAFGDLDHVTDALNQVTSYAHDAVGRVTSEANPLGTTTYVWDTAANGIGLLASTANEKVGVSVIGAVSTAYTYDALGRARATDWTVEGVPYHQDVTYDAFGRTSKVTPPSSAGIPAVTLQYSYALNGALSGVANAGTGLTYWSAQAWSPSDEVVQDHFANEVTGHYQYDGRHQLRFQDAVAYGGAVRQAVAYDYSPGGELTARHDLVAQLTERFTYDSFDRLHRWTVASGCTTGGVDYGYDDIGNLTSRTPLGGALTIATAETYGYTGGLGHGGPQAVKTSLAGTFDYDANGNQTAAPGRSVTYTPFDAPAAIVTGTADASYVYDAIHVRTVEHQANGDQVVSLGAGFERHVVSGQVTDILAIPGPGRSVAHLRRTPAGGSTDEVLYLHHNQTGSLDVATNGAGAVGVALDGTPTRYKYDPFGARRNATDYTIPAPSAPNLTMRQGFSGHTAADQFGLVDMIGRVYDPAAARFLTADPRGGSASPGASNRYAYTRNNPLRWTDPTGHAAEPIPTPVISQTLYYDDELGWTQWVGFTGWIVDPLTENITGMPVGPLGDRVMVDENNVYMGHVPPTPDRPGFDDDDTFCKAVVNAVPVTVANLLTLPIALTNAAADPSHLDEASARAYYRSAEVRERIISRFRPMPYSSQKSAKAGALYEHIAGAVVTAAVGGAVAGLAGGAAEAGEVAVTEGATSVATTGTAVEGAGLVEGEAAAEADEAFHYTFKTAAEAIEDEGLRAGSYATPDGTLSPMQAQIDLALRPNRGLPDALIRIDLAGLREAGYEVPEAAQVGRSFGMPGGGLEMQFPYSIPPEYLTVINQ